MERTHFVATLLIVGRLLAPLVPALAVEGPGATTALALTASVANADAPAVVGAGGPPAGLGLARSSANTYSWKVVVAG